MQPRTLAELRALLGSSVLTPSLPGPVRPEADDGSALITGVTHDSRAVQPGDLYAALPGTHAHGGDFAAAARAAGAVAMLTDIPGPHPIPTIEVERPRALERAGIRNEL